MLSAIEVVGSWTGILQTALLIVLGAQNLFLRRKVGAAVDPAARAATDAAVAAHELQPVNGRRQAELIGDLGRSVESLSYQLHELEVFVHDEVRQPKSGAGHSKRVRRGSY
jgi:hypothetical protein